MQINNNTTLTSENISFNLSFTRSLWVILVLAFFGFQRAQRVEDAPHKGGVAFFLITHLLGNCAAQPRPDAVQYPFLHLRREGVLHAASTEVELGLRVLPILRDEDARSLDEVLVVLDELPRLLREWDIKAPFTGELQTVQDVSEVRWRRRD